MPQNYAELEKSIYRLFEISPIPTLLTYPNGNLEYVNPAVKQLLGYDNEQIYAKDVIITHPDDSQLNQNVRKALTDNPFEPIKVEKRYIHKQGHTIPALLFIVAQPDKDANVKRYLSQIIDLRTIRQSEASQVLLNHLVELSSDAIYVVDPNSGHILSGNHLAYKRLGYSKEELLRLEVSDINRTFKGNKNPDKWTKLVEQIKLKHELVIESTHTRKDGSELPVEVNANITTFNDTRYLLAVVRDITQRKKRESEQLELSNLDPLTKLPNRRILHNRLEQIMAKNQSSEHFIAFMYIDLDGFKQINDRYGHSVGDAVLVGTANRLKSSIRQSDLIARIGGDEFLVVVNQLSKRTLLQSLASKILNQFESPFNLDGNRIDVSVSIGISVQDNNNTESSTLIKWADEAMYQAKTTPGNAICFSQHTAL